MEFTTHFRLHSQAARLYENASCGRTPARHRILTFSDTPFQGILARGATDDASPDYNSGGHQTGLQIDCVSSARFIRHY